jgi:hypothetical protein
MKINQLSEELGAISQNQTNHARALVDGGCPRLLLLGYLQGCRRLWPLYLPRQHHEPALFLAFAIEPAFPLQFAIHEHQIAGIDGLGRLLGLVAKEIDRYVELVGVPLLAGLFQQQREARMRGAVCGIGQPQPSSVRRPQRITLLMVSTGGLLGLLPLLDLHLAGFKRRGEGLCVAVREGAGEGVLFRRAFEPPQHHVSGGEPPARYFLRGSSAGLTYVNPHGPTPCTWTMVSSLVHAK